MPVARQLRTNENTGRSVFVLASGRIVPERDLIALVPTKTHSGAVRVVRRYGITQADLDWLYSQDHPLVKKPVDDSAQP